jgi:hypothetical protein
MIIGGGIDLQNNNEESSRFIRRMGLFGEINKKEGWSKWFHVVGTGHVGGIWYFTL